MEEFDKEANKAHDYDDNANFGSYSNVLVFFLSDLVYLLAFNKECLVNFLKSEYFFRLSNPTRFKPITYRLEFGHGPKSSQVGSGSQG